MYYFCFTIRGRRYCIRIPLLVDPFWKRRGPWPWLALDDKPFEHERDLQILATIDALSRELKPDFGKTLSAGIEQALSSIKQQLPEGAELNFQEETKTAE